MFNYDSLANSDLSAALESLDAPIDEPQEHQIHDEAEEANDADDLEISEELFGLGKKTPAKERVHLAKEAIVNTCQILYITFMDDKANGKKFAREQLDSHEALVYSALTNSDVSTIFHVMETLTDEYEQAKTPEQFDHANQAAYFEFYEKYIGEHCKVEPMTNAPVIEDTLIWKEIIGRWSKGEHKVIGVRAEQHDNFISAFREKRDYLYRARSQANKRFRWKMNKISNEELYVGTEAFGFGAKGPNKEKAKKSMAVLKKCKSLTLMIVRRMRQDAIGNCPDGSNTTTTMCTPKNIKMLLKPWQDLAECAERLTDTQALTRLDSQLNGLYKRLGGGKKFSVFNIPLYNDIAEAPRMSIDIRDVYKTLGTSKKYIKSTTSSALKRLRRV